MHDPESHPLQNDPSSNVDSSPRSETASEAKEGLESTTADENKPSSLATDGTTGDTVGMVDTTKAMQVDDAYKESGGMGSVKKHYTPQTVEDTNKTTGTAGDIADASSLSTGPEAMNVDDARLDKEPALSGLDILGVALEKKEDEEKICPEKQQGTGADIEMKDASAENGSGAAAAAPASSKKKNALGNVKKEDGATEKKNDSAANGTAPAEAAPAPPVLRGTLSYNLDTRRHVIRGMWNYENSKTFPAQRFELIRGLNTNEDPKDLPRDGEFHGSFSLAYYHTTSKGKQKERSKVIPESGVNIKFTKVQDEENEYKVDGKGTNQFGIFHLNGTATLSPHEGDTSYDIVLRKRYVPSEVPAPAPAACHSSEKSIKTKKRKLHDTGLSGDAAVEYVADSEKDEGPLPPPSQSYPSHVVCLRGKLFRQESQDLGMTEIVHRINGMWSSGLDLILADPQNVRGLCNRFEYEHKSTMPNNDFPVSGRYTGWFDLSNPDNTRTRISEKDVTLKFRKNSDGYHNVEGRGSNAFGKYSITGTLTLDNVITIFRHFQPRKAKKRDSTVAAVESSVTAAPGPLQGPGKAKGAAPQAAPEPKLKLDDVTIPGDGENADTLEPTPPPAHGTYSAVSRGILRLNSDGAHTCAGKWAMTREHYNNGQTSDFSFRLEPHFAAKAAATMKGKNGEEDGKKESTEPISVSLSAAPPGATTFPLDSAMYKGSFQIKKGSSKSTKVIDQQIVLKFRKNLQGSYNVYGKGINSIGEFNLVGTLILSGKISGHVELYRVYPAPPAPPVQAGAKDTGKFAAVGSQNKHPKLPTKDNAKDIPAPIVSSLLPERPRPGIQRRESTRSVKLPSRLEDDDPQALLARNMEKCGQILAYMHEQDTLAGGFFREPVDPMAHGIPTYHRVIKEPMDLGTIQRKMDKNEIASPEEFGRLARLVFENAMTFNVDPTHAVHLAGRNLLILFNQKFRDVERAVENIRRTHKPSEAERKRKEMEDAKLLKRKGREEKTKKSVKKARLDEAQAMAAANASAMAALVASAPTNSAPGGSVTRNEWNTLLQMMQKLQGQVVQALTMIANLSSSRETDDAASISMSAVSDGDSVFVPPPEVISSSRPDAKKKSGFKKKSEPAAKAPVFMEENTPLSLKEQEVLTETINLLPSERLPGVIQIIRESTHLNGDEDEIDLEIDQLDTATQRKLQRYVLQVRLAKCRTFFVDCVSTVVLV
jgi:hypothetical protein